MFSAASFPESRLEKERFIRDLTAQSDCLTQEIGCVTLTMLFSFAKLGIDQITFCSDICHDWSVSIIPFVCTGYPFFSGLGIIKRSDINVNRNKTVRRLEGTMPFIRKSSTFSSRMCSRREEPMSSILWRRVSSDGML